MPKRREPKASAIKAIQPEPTKEQIETFAAGADDGTIKQKKGLPKLDPNAKRDFKAISLRLNEYEMLKLEDGCRATGRTKLNFIRYAILKLTAEIQSED